MGAISYLCLRLGRRCRSMICHRQGLGHRLQGKGAVAVLQVRTSLGPSQERWRGVGKVSKT